MDYSVSCVNLGEFDVTSKDGYLILTTGVSLFFRGAGNGEEEVSAEKLHELVSRGLGFSGATSCRITVLAHLVEDLEAWNQLGLRLGPTARLYSHDESSVSLNYRVEHADIELPAPVSTDSTSPELESVRCHLNFAAQTLGIQNPAQSRSSREQAPKSAKKRKYGRLRHTSPHGEDSRLIVSFTTSNAYRVTVKREQSTTQDSIPTSPAMFSRDETPGVTVKCEESPSDAADLELIIHENEDLAAGMEIHMVSDHPELEVVVREALNHMLLGSRLRGARITDGFAGKALTKMAPAVFDTDRLRGVAARMPFVDGPASAVSYFAANAKSLSLRNKMQGLAVSHGASSNSRPASTQLAEARLRQLVHTDSKPISSKSSQIPGSGDVVSSLPEHDRNQLVVFSEIGIGEEMLLPGDWPPTQVSLLGTGGAGSELDQDLMPWPALDTPTAGWSCHPRNDDSGQPYMHNKDKPNPMDGLEPTRAQHHDGVPGYFRDYHGRLLGRDEDYWRKSFPIGRLAGLGRSSNV